MVDGDLDLGDEGADAIENTFSVPLKFFENRYFCRILRTCDPIKVVFH